MSAGGYHHHLGTNIWAQEGRAPGEGDARLLEWAIVLPAAEDLTAAVGSLSAAGYAVQREGAAATVADPWGTALRLRVRG